MHTSSHDNPHETSVTNFQKRFTVTVWCGVHDNKLIGPYVFNSNLTGNSYEVFLRNELPGLLEDIPLMIRSQMYFQHDGAPPHYIQGASPLLRIKVVHLGHRSELFKLLVWFTMEEKL